MAVENTFVVVPDLPVRISSTSSRPALRAASGRPPARQPHDGHRRPASPTIQARSDHHRAGAGRSSPADAWPYNRAAPDGPARAAVDPPAMGRTHLAEAP